MAFFQATKIPDIRLERHDRMVPRGLLQNAPPLRSISIVQAEVARERARWRDAHPDARREAAMRAQREGMDVSPGASARKLVVACAEPVFSHQVLIAALLGFVVTFGVFL